jgi:hypothetical protein
MGWDDGRSGRDEKFGWQLQEFTPVDHDSEEESRDMVFSNANEQNFAVGVAGSSSWNCWMSCR